MRLHKNDHIAGYAILVLLLLSLVLQVYLTYQCGWTNTFLYGSKLFWYWLGGYCTPG